MAHEVEGLGYVSLDSDPSFVGAAFGWQSSFLCTLMTYSLRSDFLKSKGLLKCSRCTGPGRGAMHFTGKEISHDGVNPIGAEAEYAVLMYSVVFFMFSSLRVICSKHPVAVGSLSHICTIRDNNRTCASPNGPLAFFDHQS
jgi:hypothetical protein